MKKIKGVSVYLTQDTKEAFNIIDQLNICRNCVQFERENLFDFKCKGIEDGGPFELSSEDSCCEVFEPIDKRVYYWLNKMTAIILEYDGHNEFSRQLTYHQSKGTEWDYLLKHK